ncbi:MAG TPA: hypothetical protein VNP93_05265 [Gaiellaceae bacterium]|nr:hypothetical protein [Gaiellaceae bacterium]
MRLGLVAAVLFLAAAVAATGHAAPAPPPGELWSEFPLEPRVETAPAAPSPDPTPRRAAGATEAGATEAGATEGEPLGRWLLLALGAAAAMATLATVGALGVPIVRSRHEDGAIAAPPAAPAAPGVRPMEVAVNYVRPEPAEPPGQSLVEVLSPHTRLHKPEQDEAGRPAEETCEIAWWRGYVKSQFYVQSNAPLDQVLASRLFRFRGSEEPEQTGAAAEAHRALVEELRAAGWVPDGRGEQWFSERFRRSGPTA